MNALSLLELNGLVRDTLEETFTNRTLWLKAELSGVSERGPHCYVEFVQKGRDANDVVAQARGHIWGSRWTFIRTYFQQATGKLPQAGMQVLVEVEVTFHEHYGYSLNVVDIDPSYTLGDIARRRREILDALADEGVADMNKEIPLSRLLQRIAIVSSPSAAGYQDFCSQLEHNPYRLAFQTRLFEATMQGQQVEPTVIAALGRIADEMDCWDAVVIIRGGGSATDLSGFDTLPLAENVAQFPLPIITGIGHERDDTVIDLVAHTRVKTPTAAAQFLIQHQKDELDALQNLSDAVSAAATSHLQHADYDLQLFANRIPTLVQMQLSRQRTRLQQMADRVPNLVQMHLSSQATRLRQQRHTLRETVLRLLSQQDVRLDFIDRTLLFNVTTLLERQRQRLQICIANVRSAQPDRILRLGFSITRLNGHAVTTSDDLHPGDTLTTTLAHGSVTSQVVS